MVRPSWPTGEQAGGDVVEDHIEELDSELPFPKKGWRVTRAEEGGQPVPDGWCGGCKRALFIEAGNEGRGVQGERL